MSCRSLLSDRGVMATSLREILIDRGDLTSSLDSMGRLLLSTLTQGASFDGLCLCLPPPCLCPPYLIHGKPKSIGSSHRELGRVMGLAAVVQEGREERGL